MQELIRKDYDYILYQEEEKLLLSVVCGTVAVFELTILLTKKEVLQYQQQGEAFTDSLASKIQYNPDDFVKRMR
jgi:hypothetical protein